MPDLVSIIQLLFMSVLALLVLLKFVKKPHTLVYALLFTTLIPFKQLLLHPRAYLFNDLLIVSLFLFMLSSSVFDRRIRIDKTGKILLLFLLSNLVGLIYIFLFSDGGVMFTVGYQYFGLVKGFMLYLIAYTLIMREEQIRVIVNVVIILAFTTSIYFIYEYIYILGKIPFIELAHYSDFEKYYRTLDRIYSEGDGNVLAAWVGGTNGRAKFSMMLAVFLLAMIDIRRGSLKSLLMILALAVIGLSIVIQMSRSTFVCFLIIALIFVLKNFRFRLNNMFRGLITVGIVLLCLFAIASNPLVLSKLNDMVATGGSFHSRSDLLSDAVKASWQNFFLGNGFESLIATPERYSGFSALSRGSNTHNAYVEILLDSGAFGLFAFILLLVQVFKNSRFLEQYASNSARQQFGLAMQLMLIAVSLNLFTAHGILKSTSLFGIVWILLGCLNRITFEEMRTMPVQKNHPERSRRTMSLSKI